jgi:hypothetical protein
VVEANAFIVRDPEGRKRILIGNLWPAESGEWYPRVALYDEHGSERICLLIGDAGVLSFAEHGNTRLEIGLREVERTVRGEPLVVVAGPDSECSLTVVSPKAEAMTTMSQTDPRTEER